MIIIALPMYNEEKGIKPLLEKIRSAMLDTKKDYRVLIIDDGSTDSSVKIVNSFMKKMPIELKRHKVNMGLGVTLKGLFNAVSGPKRVKGSDIIIMMDADNTHDPSLIKRMLPEMDRHNLVIASRYVKGGNEVGFPFYRKILSRLAVFMLRLFFPIKGITDYTCGYRAYRAELLQKAHKFYGNNFITSTGFPGSAEILIKLRRFSIKLKEVPLVLRYDLKAGQSKLKLLDTIREYASIFYNNTIKR